MQNTIENVDFESNPCAESEFEVINDPLTVKEIATHISESSTQPTNEESFPRSIEEKKSAAGSSSVYLSYKYEKATSSNPDNMLSVSPVQLNKANIILKKDGCVKDDIRALKKDLDNKLLEFEAYIFSESKDELDQKAVGLGNQLRDLGLKCMNHNFFEMAEQLFKQSLKLYCDYKKSTEEANLFDVLASFSYRVSKYSESIEYSKKALEIKKQINGQDSIDVAMTMYELSRSYYSLAQYDNYRTSLDRAYEILNKNPEKNSLFLIQLNVVQLGVYIHSCKFEKCEELICQSKELIAKYHSSNLSIARIIESQEANVYMKKGEAEKALKIIEKNYQNEMDRVPKNVIRLANLSKKLGSIKIKLGRYSSAIDDLKNSILIFQEFFKGDHPDIASVRLNLGDAYLKEGYLEKSEREITSALKSFQQHLGPDHPSVSTCFHSLGNLSYSSKKYEKAREYYMLSCNLDRKYYDEMHPEFIETYKGLGDVHVKLGQKETGLDFYGKVLKIRQRIFGLEHKDVLKITKLIEKTVQM